MSDLSYFESRHGKLTCTAENVFSFVTDIRNFEQFIPVDTVSNWSAEKESCSFNVPMLGTVSFRIAEKEINRKVEFTGDALQKNDFSMLLAISDNGAGPAEVKVTLKADLNPILKTMASGPITRFLDKLIDEMEKFSGWKDDSIHNPPL